MIAADVDRQATASGEPYRALLAVSEAIVAHRDLSALFHELAGRLYEVVRFDYLGLVLHEAASQTMRLHILESREPTPRLWVEFPIGELPEGLVWQTQQPLILADVAEETRWPRFLKQARPSGGRSACELPLTTSRRRLGTLILVSKQPSTYDAADVGFLQLVANQVVDVLVDRRGQFHQLRLAEHVTLLNPAVNLWTNYSAQTRMIRGGVTQAVAEQQGRGLLSLMVHNQAREMAYLDPFWVFAIMALAALPLVFLMKKAVARGGVAMH